MKPAPESEKSDKPRDIKQLRIIPALNPLTYTPNPDMIAKALAVNEFPIQPSGMDADGHEPAGK